MKESVVYPGEYILLPEMEKLLQDKELTHARGRSLPGVRITELKDSFKIEVFVPGIRREDIFIHAHDNMLSLVVVNKGISKATEKSQLHEFDVVCMERHIPLPVNANAEFISAEYRQGFLRICIPKTTEKPVITDLQVIVY